MSRTLTAADYLIINNADCFLAAYGDGLSVPDSMTITTSATRAVSATPVNIAVTALSEPVYEGQILKFGAVKVRVNADAAATATSISVTSVPTEIASAATATTYVLVPIYAVQSFNRQGSDQIESFATFNTKAGTTEELILGRTKQLSCKGLTTSANPGYNLLLAADEGIGKSAQLYFEFIRDDGTGYKGFANVKNFRETNEVQKAVEIQWDFGISGKLYKLSDTI
jgi:hypothetical protein